MAVGEDGPGLRCPNRNNPRERPGQFLTWGLIHAGELGCRTGALLETPRVAPGGVSVGAGGSQWAPWGLTPLWGAYLFVLCFWGTGAWAPRTLIPPRCRGNPKRRAVVLCFTPAPAALSGRLLRQCGCRGKTPAQLRPPQPDPWLLGRPRAGAWEGGGEPSDPGSGQSGCGRRWEWADRGAHLRWGGSDQPE